MVNLITNHNYGQVQENNYYDSLYYINTKTIQLLIEWF